MNCSYKIVIISMISLWYAGTGIFAHNYHHVHDYVPSNLQLLQQAQQKEEEKLVQSIVASLPLSNVDEQISVVSQESLKNINEQQHIGYETFFSASTMSVNLIDVTIQEAFKIVSLSSGVTFIVDPLLDVVITRCFFENVSLSVIIAALLAYSHNELSVYQDHGYWRVELQSKYNQRQLLKNTVTTSVVHAEHRKIVHAAWDDCFKKQVEKVWHSFPHVDKTSYVLCDDHTKTVFFRGDGSYVAAFKKVLEDLDIAVPQVKIDARIILANKDFEQAIGFDWSGVYDRRVSVKHFDWAGLGIGSVDMNEPKSFDNLLGWAVNFIPTTLADATNKLKIPLIFGNQTMETKRLNLLLDAAENKNEIKTILQPSLLVNSGQKAELLVGQEMPHQIKMQESLQGAVTNALTTNYKDIGIKMLVQPDVSANQEAVELDIFVENSRVVRPSGVLGRASAESSRGDYDYVIDTARSKNKVRLKNGQTTQISGLMVNVEESYQTGVPYLSNIPFLGVLFRGTRKYTVDKQVIIYITPTLVA